MEKYNLRNKTDIKMHNVLFATTTEKDRKVMIRDIESAVNYGDSCDERDWKELLKILNGSDKSEND